MIAAAGSVSTMVFQPATNGTSCTAYAPIPKNAAWPRLTSPVPPTSNCKLSANIAVISAVDASCNV